MIIVNYFYVLQLLLIHISSDHLNESNDSSNITSVETYLIEQESLAFEAEVKNAKELGYHIKGKFNLQWFLYFLQ